MVALRRHLRFLRTIITVLTISLVAVVSTALAQNSASQPEAALGVIMMIATGIMLPLLIVLFALYRKLSEDVGPLVEAVDTLKLWRESVEPQLQSVDTRDAKGRHDIRNEMQGTIMSVEVRLSDDIRGIDTRLTADIREISERIMYIERALMNKAGS